MGLVGDVFFLAMAVQFTAAVGIGMLRVVGLEVEVEIGFAVGVVGLLPEVVLFGDAVSIVVSCRLMNGILSDDEGR